MPSPVPCFLFLFLVIITYRYRKATSREVLKCESARASHCMLLTFNISPDSSIVQDSVNGVVLRDSKSTLSHSYNLRMSPPMIPSPVFGHVYVYVSNTSAGFAPLERRKPLTKFTAPATTQASVVLGFCGFVSPIHGTHEQGRG